MSREQTSKMIDGRFYEFSQMGTKKSLKVLATLTRLLGEPLAIALGSATEKKASKLLDSNMSPELLGKAVHALIDRMDDDQILALIEELASRNVMCDHKPIIFDLHYSGDIVHLFKVVMAAIEAQFGNFSGALSASLSKASAEQGPVSVT